MSPFSRYCLTLAGGLGSVPLQTVAVHDGVSAELEPGAAREGDHAAVQLLLLLAVKNVRWRLATRLWNEAHRTELHTVGVVCLYVSM